MAQKKRDRADVALDTIKPGRRNAAATRKRLAETAERLFAEYGYAATPIDRIAAEAGVNKRMIYVYFTDKDGLYLSVLRDNFERALSSNQSALDPRPATCDTLDRTYEQIRHYFNYLGHNPSFVRLLMRENLDGGVRAGKALMGLAANTLEEMYSLVRTGVAEGYFRSDLDPRKLVQCINAMCLGYFAQRPLSQALWGEDLATPEALTQMEEFILDLVMKGIRARDPHATSAKE